MICPTDFNKVVEDEEENDMELELKQKRAKRSVRSPLNAADRTERCGEVARIVSEWNSMTQLNKLHTQDLLLGAGAHGRVISRWLSTIECIAIKCTPFRCNDPYKDVLGEPNEQRYIHIEPTIAGFLTKNLTRYSPHFCDTFAYSVEPLAFSNNNQVSLVDSLHGSTIMLMHKANETLCNRLQALFRADDTASIMSLIVQAFISFGTMARIGLSHNDTMLANLLVDHCDRTSTIRYVEANGSDPIVLRTHGNLLLVCDLGAATHDDYWCVGKDPRCETGKTLTHWFAYDRDIIKGKPRGYLLYPENVKRIVHPLHWVDFADHERDFVFFCNMVLWEVRHHVRNTLLPKIAYAPVVTAYIKTVLKDLETLAFTADEPDYAAFANKVTRPRYVDRFCNRDMVFIESETHEATECYTYPTQIQAALLRADLLIELETKLELQKIHCFD